MKKNILKKSLLVAFGAIALASCGIADTPASDDGGTGTTPEFTIATVLENQWFKVANAYYHGSAFPAATISAGVSSVTLSEAIVVGGTAYANITVVTDQNFRRFFLGIPGLDEYWEAFPLSRDDYVTSSVTSVEYDEETGIYTYVIPIQYVDVNNTKFTIVLTAEDQDCNFCSLTEVEPEDKGNNDDGDGDGNNGDDDNNDDGEKDPGVGGDPEDLHVYITFDQHKDIDLYLVTPHGKEIYWQNLSGTIKPSGSSTTYKWWLDVDAYHWCNMVDPLMEHIYIPKAIVAKGKYTVRVNLHKHCDAIAKDVNWKLWATYDKKPVTNDLTGKVVTKDDPITGTYPAYCTAYPVGAGGGEVYLEFTVDGPYTGSALARGKRTFTDAALDEAWENCVVAPMGIEAELKTADMEDQ